MLVKVHPLNVKSLNIFNDLLSHHQIPHMQIRDGEQVVYQMPNSCSHRLGHRDFLPFVSDVHPIKTDYQLVSRDYKAEDTIVRIKDFCIGDGSLAVMAGPCSVEDKTTMLHIAEKLSQMGVKILRGGAFKPRTSPYSFQGLGEEGLRILREVADKFDMAAVSEVLDIQQMDMAEAYLDCIQIGARSMQNFELLRRCGRSPLPILLKRGPSATIEEFLLAAEYIYAHGNSQIILCERGIKTFEPMTRNTFDINAVALLKQLTHLPVVADPSHGTGLRKAVSPVALSAIAAGADGVLVESHIEPERAVSDGHQTIDMKTLETIVQKGMQIKEVVHAIVS